jgi:ELWxxDGT repeat protein
MKNIYTLLLSLVTIISTATAQVTLITDYNPGPEDGFDDFNFQGHIINDQLIFPLQSPTAGEELGILGDGEILLLKDLWPGMEDGDPRGFTMYQGELYFSAYAGEGDINIWKTDGTEAGTVMVHDPGNESSARPGSFVVADNGWMYYSYANSIRRTDGIDHEVVYEGAIIGTVGKYASPNYVKYEMGLAFLVKNDSDDSFTLYQITGNEVTEIARTEAGGFFTNAYGLTTYLDGLLFAVNDDDDIEGTYYYDAVSGNLTNINIVGQTKPYSRLLAIPDKGNILYVAGDGFYYINGNPQDDKFLFSTGFFGAYVQGENMVSAKVEGRAAFTTPAELGEDDFLFITDGTSDGTLSLSAIQSHHSAMIVEGKYCFFADGISNGFRPNLYQVDLEEGTVSTLMSFDERSLDTRSIKPMGVIDDKLYFLSKLDPDVGLELYAMPVSIEPSSVSENPTAMPYAIIQKQSSIEIRMDENLELQVGITTQDGRTVYQGNHTTNEAIEMNLATGVYYVTITSKGQVQSSAFMWQRQ